MEETTTPPAEGKQAKARSETKADITARLQTALATAQKAQADATQRRAEAERDVKHHAKEAEKAKDALLLHLTK